MSIRYTLFNNHLTSNNGGYLARIQSNGTVDTNDIIDRMTELGSTVTKADSLAVLEDSVRAIESLLLDGYRVNFGGIVRLYPSLKGVFKNITDSYDPGKHKINVIATPGKRIIKRLRNDASMEKISRTRPPLSLIEFKDLGSGAVNEIMTMNNIGTLNGYRLKFNPENSDEGIFMTRSSDNTETKITEVQKNKPSQIVFLIPSGLKEGETYSLKIKTRQGGKKLKSGVFEKSLTVRWINTFIEPWVCTLLIKYLSRLNPEHYAFMTVPATQEAGVNHARGMPSMTVVINPDHASGMISMTVVAGIDHNCGKLSMTVVIDTDHARGMILPTVVIDIDHARGIVSTTVVSDSDYTSAMVTIKPGGQYWSLKSKLQ